MEPYQIPVIIKDVRNVCGRFPMVRVYENWKVLNTDYDRWSEENKNYTKFLANLVSCDFILRCFLEDLSVCIYII